MGSVWVQHPRSEAKSLCADVLLVQKFLKAIEPKGDARPEWEFLHELIFDATGQNGFTTIEGLFNQMAREVPAFKGLTWAGLGDLGAAVPI